MLSGMKPVVLVLSSALILCGCVNSTQIIRLTENNSLVFDKTALVWTYGGDGLGKNLARVTAVDGVQVSYSGAPVEVSPGQHSVNVAYRRTVFCLASILGPPCVYSTENRTLPLRVGADHSYMPFASRTCDMNWVWIQDTGRSPNYDLNVWRNSRTMVPEHDLVKDVLKDARLRNMPKKNIVAGELPPEQCRQSN
jgi:hypothetical protein